MIMTETAYRGIQVPSLRNVILTDDNAAEYELAKREMTEDADLLDLVPQDQEVWDHRSPAQINLTESLIREITNLDGELGHQARIYTDGMTERGLWTAGRDSNASAWIGRMIEKARELRATTSPRRDLRIQETPEVPSGRYAVEHDGTLKFFHVRHGRPGTNWEKFTFVSIQTSDELHPIKNRATKAEILALIAADPEAALVRYGQELGVCGDCGRTLTDAESRVAGRGPICRSR